MKILTPLAVIAVSIGMYFLYISPSALEVGALMKQKAEYDNVLEKAKELTQKRDELSASYQNISQADIERLNKIVPEKFDPVVMAHDLSVIAAQNRLSFADFKTSVVNQAERGVVADPQNALPYKVNMVSIKLAGQYADFLRFLDNVELNLRLLDIENLDIAPLTASDKPTDTAMQFTLQINTYSLN